MLFQKKKSFSITEKQIKEELPDESGSTVLKINIRYPILNCPKKDPLLQNASGFYPRLAENFLLAAKSELLKASKAKKRADPEAFLPFSAVMSWRKMLESERFLSIVIDIFVSDGREQSTVRRTQVWERKFGTKCKSSMFFEKKELDLLRESKGINKKSFDRELFSINERGFVFYTKEGEVFIPFDERQKEMF